MPSVLLLNASFEPLRLIDERRAIMLVVAEKAEVIEARPGRLRSAHCEFPRPSVVRLVSYVVVPYRARIPLNRRAVVTRDKATCAYCKKAGDTMDHVVPRSKGGLHRWENVVCACRRCNGKKSDKTLEQMGWKLDFKPFAPTGVRWLLIGVVELEPAWEPYLAAA